MKNDIIFLRFRGVLGTSGSHPVFLGFAPANILKHHSFADILKEDTGEGYQRPFNRQHSIDFKRYITANSGSTPPLTFNLRKDQKNLWSISTGNDRGAVLILRKGQRCLAQVDCQHRLGELDDVDTELPFMAYIGLDLRQEMAIFNVINSKAKGLSSSLTDYHESKLLSDLANEAPHLFISRRLNEDKVSPWFKMIRYGGETTSGLRRRASFRMMQKTVASFLTQIKNVELGTLEDKYQIILNFWTGIQDLFANEWENHRHNLITKGVGLYSLMLILADIVRQNPTASFSVNYFKEILSPLKGNFDWSSNGRFAYVGGRKGVQNVYSELKEVIFESPSR
jgi:DNA sulfur modification protein DndB